MFEESSPDRASIVAGAPRDGAAAPPDVALPAVTLVPPVASAPPPAARPTAAPGREAAARPGVDDAAAQIAVAQRRADELRVEAHHRHAEGVAGAAVAAAVVLAQVVRPEERVHHREPSVAVEPHGALAEPVLDDARDETFADRFERDVVTYTEMDEADDLQADAEGVDGFGGGFEAYTPGDADDDLGGPQELEASGGSLDPDAGSGLPSVEAQTIEPKAGSGPAEVGVPHVAAEPWNGQTTIGTISLVDGDRVEQYTGRGTWTSFSISNDLHGVTPELGSSVQIGGDGRIGPTPEQQLSLQPELTRGLGLGAG